MTIKATVGVGLDEAGDLRLEGAYYLDVLARLHAAFEPRTYFEIGTLAGDTLRLARCPAVAVDPRFQLKPGVQDEATQAQLFETTSDDFFARHDPRRLLGRRIDLAFLDGMHEFGFLLRDFVNTERSCLPGSMIVMHDCIPGDAWMTRPHAEANESGPTRFPGWWTGDVWKIVPVLRALRPDLRVTCLDARPTGLVVVRGLNPHSRVLDGRVEALIEAWAPIRLADYGMDRLLAEMRPVSADAWLETVRPVRLERRLRRKFGAALNGARLAGRALSRRPAGRGPS